MADGITKLFISQENIPLFAKELVNIHLYLINGLQRLRRFGIPSFPVARNSNKTSLASS
jgi:hypothetical protein